MVQTLFFIGKETSDYIMVSVIWGKGSDNDRSCFLALNPSQVRMVKNTCWNGIIARAMKKVNVTSFDVGRKSH